MANRVRPITLSIRVTAEERDRLRNIQAQMQACTLRDAIIAAMEHAAADGVTVVADAK